MKKNIFWLLLLIGFSSFAQTKKIAHRSHSGKDIAMEQESEDNFGNPRAEYRDSIYIKKINQLKDSLAHKPAIDSVKKNQPATPYKKKTKKIKPAVAVLPKKIKPTGHPSK